jgi:DNA primase
LFGLHRAKIAGERRLVVTEGYTDVIACHLAGFPGAVASLGTAFTADHARMVERYATDGLVLMFDGDRAGQQAAERAMRELANSRIEVRMALMSDAQDGTAKDPADVVTARAGEDPELVHERRARFADTIEGAEPALTVWFRLLRRRLDLSQAVHVETAARECAAILGLVDADVRRAALLQEMARHLAIPAPALDRLLRKVGGRPKSASAQAASEPAPQAAPARPRSLLERSELEMLACVLARPELTASIDPDAPWHLADVATLVAMAADGVEVGRTATPDLLRYLFARAAERETLRSVLAEAAELATRLPDPRAVLAGLVEGRRRLSAVPDRRELRQRFEQALAAGDRRTADELQRQWLAQLRRDRPRSNPPEEEPAGTETAGGDEGVPFPESEQSASRPAVPPQTAPSPYSPS